MVATTANLLVYALPSKAGSPVPSPKGKRKGKAKKGKSSTGQKSLKLELKQTIELPATLEAAGGTFRVAK